MISFLCKLLKNKKQIEPAPADFFEEDWYLSFYPDVARAGMSGWTHFNRHGRYEGRFACAAHTQIWCDPAIQVSEELSLLPNWTELSIADRNYLAWMYGRWFALHEDWTAVVSCMRYFDFKEASFHSDKSAVMPFVLYFQSLYKADQKDAAAKCWQSLEALYADSPILGFLRANHALYEKMSAEQWLAAINEIYTCKDLCKISLEDGLCNFDSLVAPETCYLNQNAEEKISIIIPVYNGEKTLATALRGLCQQTWQALEIIVVDDASTDQTVAIVEEWIRNDPRIKLLALSENQGAYTARNLGMQSATGDFLTVHDADDWSHPQKLEMQVACLLEDKQIMASLSHWARVNQNLELGSWKDPSGWSGLCHRNISSLMIRRQVIKDIGYWDRVRCSADTEYYYRLQRFYGEQALKEVLPGIPLAMGRLGNESLTQRSETSIFTIYSGLRREYAKAYNDWHRSVDHLNDLYMPMEPQKRLFSAPNAMLPKQITL